MSWMAQSLVQRRMGVQLRRMEMAKLKGKVAVVTGGSQGVNAGVYQFGPLEAVTEAEFHRQFNTNVLGTLLATQEAVNHFGSKGGSVINLSSIVSVNSMPNSVVYSATKSAVDSITRTLALDL